MPKWRTQKRLQHLCHFYQVSFFSFFQGVIYILESSRRISSTSSIADDDLSESNFSMKDEDASQTAVGKLLNMMTSIQQEVKFLNHQVSFLKKALHLPGCCCVSCLTMVQKMDRVESSQEESPKEDENTQKENNNLTVINNHDSVFPDAEPSPNLLDIINSANSDNFDFSGKRRFFKII